MNIINIKDNLYYIGGIVRDTILNLPSKDIDITFVGNAIELCKSFDEGEILQINEKFGTVKMDFCGKVIDFASTRSETYPKAGHLPVIQKIGCPLKDDVLRRDFTINALAKSTKTGEIIDFVGGLKDINERKIRVLHDKSFIDDPTRILRALKFRFRFGFDLEQKTRTLQENYIKNVNYDMCFKRVKKELEDTLNLNSQALFETFITEKIYKLLGNFEAKIPQINFEELIKKYHTQIKSKWLIYAGSISNLENLPLTRFEQKVLDEARALENAKLTNDFEIRKTLDGKPIESILIFAAKNKPAALKYLDELKNIKISLTGNDLCRMGYTPSARFGECLDYVLAKKIQNPSLSREQEFRSAKEFLD